MEYLVLDQDTMDETIVEFLEAQEKDHFCHSINQERYNRMLETLPAGPWKDRITQLRDETVGRLEEVIGIINATKPQLPSEDRIAAAKERIAEKRANAAKR